MTAISTGSPIVDWLLLLLDTWGYLIVALATTLENTFIVGSFTPGETIVVVTGVVAARGSLSVWLVWGLAVAGSVLGSNISYWLGYRGGRDVLERWGDKVRISGKRLLLAEEYFAVHGSKTVFVARFAAGVKNFVPMLAGVARMKLAVFEAYTVAGAIVYSAVMVALGYFFGRNLDLLLKYLARAGWVGLGIIVLIVVAAVWGTRRRRKHTQEELAEEIAEHPELLRRIGLDPGERDEKDDGRSDGA
jgi:membrane protein DedA with SNARE-associated domain